MAHCCGAGACADAGYNGQLARGGSKIFVDKHPGQNRDTTHVVSVVGWGLDDETELK
jgi:hypothetical protein